ncbi:hypothetical protein PMZ80_000954 [Knufia obscura]|uniref:F-box domain-containing protein n=2 Tax=Knufia TaxID=430999 RepID=A0AAN8I1Y3_9EURO|nr:hypothetical protein PMZ80_000954 [Knufia obscura]KAK5950252.1 hypothetical protein OHC33_008720 [Knufia fluminis]
MSATPTLMGLPAELRRTIYKYLFSGQQQNLLYSSIFKLGSPDLEKIPGYSLLSVCRQIRNEALDHYRVRLAIIGEYRTILPVSQEEYKPNPFANTLSTDIRLAIVNIEIKSSHGFDGSILTKDAFPNLKEVLVHGMNTTSPHVTQRLWLPRTQCNVHPLELEQEIFFTLPADQSTVTAYPGHAHDAKLVARAKRIMNGETMRNTELPTGGKRGYTLLCNSVMCVTHQTRYPPLFEFSLNLSMMWNYDTQEIVEKRRI